MQHHVRDTIVVDDALLRRLRLQGRKAGGPFRSATLVGRNVHLAGAVFASASQLTILADELDGVAVQDPARSFTARATDRGPEQFDVVGLRGPIVEVTAAALGPGAGLTTHGGRGGPGRDGKPGGHIPDPHWEGDPPPPQIPLPGHDGDPGAQGGDSGPLTVEVVGVAPTAGAWLAEPGRGGPGGKGGAGDPPGGDATSGVRGNVIAPVLRAIEPARFATRQAELIVLTSIDGRAVLSNQHLERSALDRFRRGDLDGFGLALVRSDAVFHPVGGGAAPVSPLAHALDTARRRRAEHRDHVGLPRDLDVDPVLTAHTSTRFLLGRGIDSLLFPDRLGNDLWRNLPDGRIPARATAVAERLETYRRPQGGGVVAAGDLERQAGYAAQKRQRADVLRSTADAHVTGLLEWLRPRAAGSGPLSLADGTKADPVQLVEALAALPARGVALPVAPDLVVRADRAPLGPFSTDDPALAGVLAGGRDLRQLGDWASAVPAAGVHLRRVTDQLAAATGSTAEVLAGLRELADLARQQVRLELRARQWAAAATERDDLAAEAGQWASRLRAEAADPGVATPEVAVTLLEGVRVMTDVLAWDARLDDRALALRTGDLRHDQAVWDLWADALAIDHILDWHEAPWLDAGPGAPTPDPDDPAIELAQQRTARTDQALRSFLAATNGPRRSSHAERGLLLQPGNSRLTITRVFDGGDGGEGARIVARFRDTGSCWFEVPIGSLPRAADGTPRYHEVVAAGVSVRFVGARRLFPHDLEVRHSGRGVLRMLADGRVVDQPLSPETISIEMRAEEGATFGIAPTPETPVFPLAGRAVAGPWSLRLPGGGADLGDLSAIEVQFDLEAFVPTDAVTLRRVTSPAEAMIPGTSTKGTVELTGPAPAGGVVAVLTTTHPQIAQPFNAVVPAGSTSAQFDIAVHAPTGADHVVLTARLADGAEARLVLEIPIPPTPDVERTTVPQARPVRALAVLGDRTYVAIDPDDAPAQARSGREPSDPVAELVAPAAGPVPPRRLVALDPALRPVLQVPAGIGTRHLAVDPTRNRLYLVNSGAHGPDGFGGAGVTMLDARTMAPLADWEGGAGAVAAAVDSGPGLVYVSHWIGRRVFVLRADDLTPVAAIGDDTFTGATGLAVDAELRRVYVARTFRSAEPHVEALTVIERRSDGSHEISRTIPLGRTVQPLLVAVDPTLELVYVLGIGGGVPPQLIVFDRRTLDERARIVVLGGLAAERAIATREGTGIVHVTCGVGVQVLDARRATVVGLVASPRAACLAGVDADRVVGAGTTGELIRARAPRQITPVEWR